MSDAHEAVGDCENLRDALERAAQEKNLTMAEFLDMPSRKLIEDNNKFKTKDRQPKAKARKIKRLEHVDIPKARSRKKRTTRHYDLRN